MRIVADENIPGLDSTFGRYGDIIRLKGREITAADLGHADVLLVRSITRVDRQLLANSPVQFVGSATIGIDHLDTGFLQESGIHWCHAPGCNADAAAQYTLAMILLAAQRTGLRLTDLQAGIVGYGNVGRRLHGLLQLLGIKEVLACDPPLAATGHSNLVEMREIMGCNLICFHVPLTQGGPCPTHHLGNHNFFEQLQSETLVINSSRGKVLEQEPLLSWLSAGKGQAALDVWPTEPRIDRKLLDVVVVATPHVAGYSLEGKLNGTRLVYRQFLQWKGIEPESSLPPHAPAPQALRAADTISVESAILASCPVQSDDLLLRTCLQERGEITTVEFDHLRKNYPERRDFSGRLIPYECPETLVRTLMSLGFSAIAD